MKKHITILAIAIFTAILTANAEATELADSIRAQGASALAEIKGEFRDNLSRVEPGLVPLAQSAYPVDEAIRIQGQRALSSIRWELEIQFHQKHAGVAASSTGKLVASESL